MKFRIALAQMNPVVGDIRGNSKKITGEIRRAKSAGADIVLFPELALSGYPPEDLLLKPHFIYECDKQLNQIAAEVKDIVAIIGLPIIDSNSYNAAAVCAQGETVEVYRKICLPNYGVFDEQRYFAAGSEVVVLDIDGGRFGLTICEDLWHSAGPYMECVTRGGAHAVLNISASPFHADKTADRERMLIQRAVDVGAYIVYCNVVGGQDELLFDGCSCVIDPDGKVIARAPAFQTDLLLADIDIDVAIRHKLRDPRQRETTALVSSPFVEPTTITPVPFKRRAKKTPTTTVVEAIADKIDLTIMGIETGIKDYTRKNGFTKALIGISGGVDSALVAALACKSLEPKNVLGLFMPSKFSSAESAEDAAALAKNLGFELAETPIQEAVECFEKTLSPIFAEKARDVTEENIQARVRGTMLMAVSNKFGHLLLATGNKSEMSVGYATLYGDMCGGFAPIKDLPKTLVYELCRRLNDKAGNDFIPQRILDKAPTAELRENQKDSDTLPEYDVLDRILHRYIEQEMSFENIVEDGFDPLTVGQVIRMVNAGEYKRRQAPPGVKITSLAFGKDRRIPITNHFGRIEAPSAIPVRNVKKND